MKNLSMVTKVGIIAGILFFLHALIPNSHAWPLIWPGLAGISLLMVMKNTGNLNDFRHTAKSLFKTSLLSAGIFFVLTLLALYLLGIQESDSISQFFGAEAPININSSVIFGLLIASGLGIAILMVSGSIFYPLLKK